MSSQVELAEVAESRIATDWPLDQWADRILEQAGVGVTILDRHGTVMYYNKWASEHLDRKPEYIGNDVRKRQALRKNHDPGHGLSDPGQRRTGRLLSDRTSQGRGTGALRAVRRVGTRILRERNAA
jgi:hypothetical protein